MKIKTKVCGLRDRNNVIEVTELGPDYSGFIFYRRSARYAGDHDPEFLNDLSGVRKVAVSVNASEPESDNIVERYRFDAGQLHGSEDPEFCGRIRGKGCALTQRFGAGR